MPNNSAHAGRLAIIGRTTLEAYGVKSIDRFARRSSKGEMRRAARKHRLALHGFAIASRAQQNCQGVRFSAQVLLEFGPASTGPKFSVVTIFDNASDANQMIQMQGTGN